MISRIGCLIGFVLLLPACQPDRPPATDEQPAATPASPPASDDEVTAYRCEPPVRVVATHHRSTDRLSLALQGNALNLLHQASGSGAKYGEGTTTFWSKGDLATVEFDGITYACRTNARDTDVERIRLAGAEFRGWGNEPGWMLTVWPDSVVLVENYGADTLRFPGAVPEVDSATARRLWSLKSGERELTLAIAASPCHDDMSGEPFEATVQYVLDRLTTRRGCGNPLR